MNHDPAVLARTQDLDPIYLENSCFYIFSKDSFAATGNRLGSAVYSAPQLKGMQEVITLVVFAVFSAFYLDQPLKWNHYAAFGLIVIAAFLMFKE